MCVWIEHRLIEPGWFKICVGFKTGTPKGSPKVGFMEEPGIEPATHGLQGIALFHYTTGASQDTVMLYFVSHFMLCICDASYPKS